MSDTSNFGFGKFVPGFDFLQSLTKGASGKVPQLPSLSSWVAPTISVEELEKRIDELKAVQFWLEQNSRALTATVQALEVQKMTLATLKGMNFSMDDVANAFKLKTPDSVMGSMHKAATTMSGAAQAVAGAAARATGHASATEYAPQEPAPQANPEPASTADKEKSKGPTPDAAAAQVVDPMQWWGALTNQFQQIATAAMKDAAQQNAIDTTKNMAAEALKTATDMASQFAATGMKGMSGGQSSAAKTRTASAPAQPAANKPASKKSAGKKTTAQPAAKAAPKAAPRKTPARKPAARKSAS